MQHLFRLVIVLLVFLSIPAYASKTIYKVLEQDADGVASHRAFDRTSIGDGIDPVLQFIMLDAPTDRSTAQLLWEASEKPIPWARTADVPSYRMVEYADLPEDGSLEYRIHINQTGDEIAALRHVRSGDDGNYAVDPSVINALPDGLYDIHVRLLIPDQPVQILKQRIDVSDVAVELIADQGLENEEDLAPILQPGTGFVGETPQPASIGNSQAIAIAQWNVVPEQQISGAFNVGVVAHHIEGIDYVAISLDGGPWVQVESPSINPRTGSEEYWATLDAAGQTGWKEVRSIAVPIAGTPRVLPSIRLYAGESATLFPEIVLEAGTYDGGQLLNRVGEHAEGWATIRAADGVSRDKVIITGNMRTNKDLQLRFLGVTRQLGHWDEHNGSGNWAIKWWFDDTRIEGNIRSRWIVHESGRQYYTDTTITDMQTTFSGATLLARNVVIERGWEDICRTFGMMVNVTVNKLDRGEFETYHPDLFQWHGSNVTNFIAQDVTSPNTIGQGLFPGDIQDSAFVRMNITTVGNYRALQMQGKTKNVLIKDSRFNGPGNLRYDKGFEPTDLVFRDSTIGDHGPQLPEGWRHEEIRVYPIEQTQIAD